MQSIDAARWFSRSHAYEQGGRTGDAIRAFQSGLRLVPDSPEAWFDFGRLLRRCGAADAAIDAYGRSIALGIHVPEVALLETALVHSDLRRDDHAAETALKGALSIRPDYAPAWLNWGNLCEDLGRRDDASSHYRAALAHAEHDSTLADLALARLLEVLRPSARSEECQRAQARMAMPRPASPERADLAFALGRCLEREGAHGAAFASFLEANRIAGIGHPPYDRGASEARFAQRRAAVREHAPPRVAAPGGGATPLFIVGLFRSGSTLLEQMLAAHPAISTLGESPFFPHLAARLRSPIARLSPDEASRYSEAYERHARQWLPHPTHTDRFRIDKRPDNADLLPLILQVRPDSRILVTRRDPRDNGLSIFQHHLDPRIAPYSTDLAAIGHHLGLHRRFVDQAAEALGDRLLVVDYEALTTEPEATLDTVLSWLGLPASDTCLRFHQQASSVRTASVWQVREPVHARAQGRWKPYVAWLAPLLGALEENDALRR